MRYANLNFLTENRRRRKSDREADAGVEQRIVVREIVKIAAKDVAVHAQVARKRLRKTHLVVVRAPRPDRDPQDQGVQGIKLWRARQQQIFNGGSLKDAVVRSVDEGIARGNESRDPDPRAPGRFIHHKSVMVKPQTHAQVPAPQTNLVLRVRGRLHIPSLVGKRNWKRQLSAGIKLGRIGDAILQRFMHWAEDSVRADFPVMAPVMAREVRAHVSFPVSAILRDNDRGRQHIRRKKRGGVAHVSGYGQQQIRRKSMCVSRLSAGLLLRGVLALAGLLLNQLVWHKITNRMLSHSNEKPVAA